MVFCNTFRCEEEAKEHQASQRAIADELEEKQARCVQLRAASEAFQGQLLEAEESKKKVGREIFLDKGLYFVRVHVPTTCVVPAVTWADTVWMVQSNFMSHDSSSIEIEVYNNEEIHRLLKLLFFI